MAVATLAPKTARRPRRSRSLPDLIPDLGVDSGETIRVRKVRRRDRDGIPRLAGERRLPGEDGIGIESVGRRRRDPRLSEDRPELRRLGGFAVTDFVSCFLSLRAGLLNLCA
jgi:hypothetical protein